MVSAPVRRQQIAYVCQRGRSVRRACALLSVSRSTLGYESKIASKDAPVLKAMHELAAQYPRYGYRRIQVFLERQGQMMSADRVHRIWRFAGSKCLENGHGDGWRVVGRAHCLHSEQITCGPTISFSTPAPMVNN